MQNINTLKKQISMRVSGMKHGYFITVDSKLTTATNKIDADVLTAFANSKIKRICDAMNVYCFGRSYKRGDNKLKIVSAIEIGSETNRLHAHLIMLHQGDCVKTVEQIEKRMKQICVPVLGMSGMNARDVKVFDPKQDWVGYFVKSTEYMNSKYSGFMNVELY